MKHFIFKSTIERINLIIEEIGVQPTARNVVIPAHNAAAEAKSQKKGHSGVYSGAALELRNGDVITGKNSPLMHAPSAVVLNAIKYLAEVPSKIDLISPNIMVSIGDLKQELDEI